MNSHTGHKSWKAAASFVAAKLTSLHLSQWICQLASQFATATPLSDLQGTLASLADMADTVAHSLVPAHWDTIEGALWFMPDVHREDLVGLYQQDCHGVLKAIPLGTHTHQHYHPGFLFLIIPPNYQHLHAPSACLPPAPRATRTMSTHFAMGRVSLILTKNKGQIHNSSSYCHHEGGDF